MNVLSIDFDFFILAGEKAQPFFPDGGSEFDGLQDIVWANAYASAKNKSNALISDTKVDTVSLSFIGDIIKNNPSARFMFTDSHKYAYGFIVANATEKVDLWNVDFHHDVYRGKELHCGNWLRMLIENGHTDSVYWIGRPESDRESMTMKLQNAELCELPDAFDLIFICRSGWWTPPHLDTFFINSLVQPVFDSKRRVKFEKGIEISRYTQEFSTVVEELSLVYNRHRRGFTKH